MAAGSLKVDWAAGLHRAVTMLHFGKWEEKEEAAKVIAKLAEEDVKRRRVMAELGVIPPLVAMVGSEVAARRRLAVKALIEVANGSSTNKASMVEAGLLSRLPKNTTAIEDDDESSNQELAHLLLSISSLSKTQFFLQPPGIIPTAVSILQSNPNLDTTQACLATLHNLSSLLDNAATLSSTKLIDILITMSCSIAKGASEKALSTLANLVITAPGRAAIERHHAVPEGLIEIMTRGERPRCQELSAYVLMMLAHQSSLQRRKMADAGIVRVLLEVGLLGSPLAQKRAMKILQWFKDDRQKPQVTRRMSSFGSPDVGENCKILMKKIVKQSLNKNMETITRRASGAEDSSSRIKALVISSSSKSLPY
ncbi:uncharacterized protein LOC127247692 [Andrographis paniculata]|uniref:uncharacterized protein LOC127247692 n=1 Tax=Andrographis paniculata TaxID=175694 RepID=UPI0021E78CED|nr:uncharacterized protein LOC127247692 [Andrographis paniculata]